MWPYPCERWPGEGGPHNARLIQSRRSNFTPNVIYLWRRYLYLFLLRYYYYCGHVVALMINLSSGGRLMVDGIRAWRTHMPYAIHRATATLPEPQPHQMAFTVIQIETASVCRRVFRAICLSCVIASFLSHMNSYGFGYNDAFSLFTSSSTRWWYTVYANTVRRQWTNKLAAMLAMLPAAVHKFSFFILPFHPLFPNSSFKFIIKMIVISIPFDDWLWLVNGDAGWR